MNIISWNKNTTDPELFPLLQTLSGDYPIVENSSTGTQVTFEKQENGLDILPNTVIIKYNTISGAARGIGKLLSAQNPNTFELSEQLPFDMFGILIDCSRNATVKVEYFKKYLRSMALMGYNMAMLYTKDAYQLPGEDFFGYLRGSYSLEELQDIDSYAAKLGIEMIGSVQALGHLEPTLQWPAYGQVKDTPSVILTSEEKSYELINKIIEFWSKAFRSRRLHLGMDETHDLGRGRYMDMNGYKRGYDIFNEHLQKVTTSCQSFNIKPIIWSDMYFRMGSNDGEYYDQSLVIPKNIKNDIPKSVQLNYWDYYHDNEEFYIEWIRRHRNDLGFEPIMASGIWSWALFWQNFETTIANAVPCMDACIKEGVKDFFFTVWADDGAFCNLESTLAGAALMAEKAFSKSSKMDDDKAKQLFEAICRSDYNAHKEMSKLTQKAPLTTPGKDICARAIFWDDPLLQIYRKNQLQYDEQWSSKVISRYKNILNSVANVPKHDEASFEYGKTLLSILIHKLELMDKLDCAYVKRDCNELKNIWKLTSEINSELEEFSASFREYQYERYNPQGFEIFQIRIGGLKERFKEVSLRVEELISGKIDSIPELHEKASYRLVNKHYHDLATAAYFV